MNFKTFFGLIIALMSVFCVFVSVDIIHWTKEPVWAFMTVISGFGVIGGIAYAIEDTKLGERLANLFKEGE